jgi:hypothetical protein
MPARRFSEIGDRLTKALIDGDFDLYRSVMDIPLRVAPRDDAAYVLETEAALSEDFDQYHAVIKSQGVTDIFRQVLYVQDIAADRQKMVCLTHILVHAHRLVDPFETSMTLVLRTDGWRISEIESSEGHIKWTLGRAFVGPGGTFDPKR